MDMAAKLGRSGVIKEPLMSIARVTEVTASSTVSFEDAVKKAVARADKTLNNVEGAWVQEQKVVVRNGEIAEYRVNLKITFVLED